MSGDLLDTAAAGPAAIRGGILRTAGYIAGVLFSLGSAALLFHHLGVEDSGRYVTIQAIVVIGAGITDAGLTVIGVREYAVLQPARREAVLRDLLGLRVVLTLLGMAGAVVFTAVAGYGETLVLGAAITGVAVLLTTLQHQLGIGLVAELRQGWVSAADLLRQIVTTAVIAALVLAGASLLAFFTANLVAGVAAVALVVAVTRGTMPLRPTLSMRRLRGVLADTLVYAAATAVGAIYLRLALVLVSLVASAEETGYYGAAFRGVEVLVAVPVLLVGAAFPILARAARDDRARLAYALGRLTDVLVICGAGVALALATGAPFIVRVVAGDDFEPAADVLRIQGLGLLFSFIGAGFGYAALSLRRHREVLLANTAALVTCATLVPILASSDGALGAAVAIVLCEAVLAAGLALGVHRAGVSVAPDLRGLTRAAAALGLALLPWLLPVSSAAHLVLCGAVYVGALLVLRALPPELRGHLPAPLR